MGVDVDKNEKVQEAFVARHQFVDTRSILVFLLSSFHSITTAERNVLTCVGPYPRVEK